MPLKRFSFFLSVHRRFYLPACLHFVNTFYTFCRFHLTQLECYILPGANCPNSSGFFLFNFMFKDLSEVFECQWIWRNWRGLQKLYSSILIQKRFVELPYGGCPILFQDPKYRLEPICSGNVVC